MWVENRKGGDILHSRDRETCEWIACQLCQQQCRYQRRGTKRTIFPLVETRWTNRQSSRPAAVPGCYQQWNQGLTDRVVHKGVYISRKILLLRLYVDQRKVKQTNEKENCDYTQSIGVYPSHGQEEHGIQGRRARTQPFR